MEPTPGSPHHVVHPPPLGAESRDDAPRILVVDDDPDFREIVAGVLCGRGYRVLGTRDGLDAIEDPNRVIANFGALSCLDLVITDLLMPHASGFELLEHLRSRAWRASVIVVSAYLDLETWARALRLGATTALPKPFEMEELVELVERLAPIPGRDPGHAH